MKIFSKNRYHNAKIYSLDAGLYQIVVESDDGREIFGEISFKIKKDRTWIHSISTEYRYQHQGIGQALIDLCELISAVKGMDKIEGLYCPSNEHAYPFYEKMVTELKKKVIIFL